MTGNIELRLYRYFVALCEERNYARAAERLKITPPTLTHQIQKLEKDLAVRLLDRSKKTKIRLTQAGMSFLDSARNVLHQADEAELSARRTARGEIGRIEIGYMITAAYSGLIQRLIGNFQKQYPAVDITYQQLSTVKQFNAILSNEIDAGFTRAPNQYPSGLSGFTIYRQPIMLAVPGTHPLAHARGPVPPKALADELFVSTSIEFDLAFKRHAEYVGNIGGFTPKVCKRAEDLTTVLTYVSSGYGIAAVPEELSNCHMPNVVFKPIASNIVPETVLAFIHRTSESAPACKALIAAMRAQALKKSIG
ncbi:MAG TPA: LysR substrate-binding domain-containing protein [Xanthobacteraceae bacterium]|nr:LysR substrate-binding domain-containing protein [Xanthobacteraceae bacterium]